MRLLPLTFGLIYDNIFANQIKEYIPPDMKPQIFVLYVTGFWPPKKKSFLYDMLSFIYFVFIGVVFPLTLFLNIFFAESIDEAMNYLFISITCWNSAFKAAVIYSQRENIRKLFHMHADMLRGGSSESDRHFDQIARTNVNMYKYFQILYCSAWIAKVIQTVLSKPENRVWASTSHMPYKFAQNHTVYISGLLYQITCGLVIVIWTAVEDTYTIALMTMACGHVTQLKARSKILGTKYPAGVDRDRYFYMEVIDCCKRYVSCLRFD